MVFCCYSTSTLATDLNYTDQIEFETTVADTCFEGQKKQEANKGIEDFKLEQYCDCTARAITAMINYSDIDYFTEHNKYSDTIATKINAVGQECIDHLSSIWNKKPDK